MYTPNRAVAQSTNYHWELDRVPFYVDPDQMAYDYVLILFWTLPHQYASTGHIHLVLSRHTIHAGPNHSQLPKLFPITLHTIYQRLMW